MNTMEQDYIIGQVGAENWTQVVEAFLGVALSDVTTELNRMFPAEEGNDELARLIFIQMEHIWYDED